MFAYLFVVLVVGVFVCLVSLVCLFIVCLNVCYFVWCVDLFGISVSV